MTFPTWLELDGAYLVCSDFARDVCRFLWAARDERFVAGVPIKGDTIRNGTGLPRKAARVALEELAAAGLLRRSTLDPSGSSNSRATLARLRTAAAKFVTTERDEAAGDRMKHRLEYEHSCLWVELLDNPRMRETWSNQHRNPSGNATLLARYDQVTT